MLYGAIHGRIIINYNACYYFHKCAYCLRYGYSGTVRVSRSPYFYGGQWQPPPAPERLKSVGNFPTGISIKGKGEPGTTQVEGFTN